MTMPFHILIQFENSFHFTNNPSLCQVLFAASDPRILHHAMKTFSIALSTHKLTNTPSIHTILNIGAALHKSRCQNEIHCLLCIAPNLFYIFQKQ